MSLVTVVLVLVSLSVGAFSKDPKWHREYERRFNALEKKVHAESIEFRDEIHSLTDQMKDNDTACACYARGMVYAVDDSADDGIAHSAIIDTLLAGFRAEKENIRRSLSVFEGTFDKYSDELADLRNVDDGMKDKVERLEKGSENDKRSFNRGMKNMDSIIKAETAACDRKIQDIKTTFERETGKLKTELDAVRQEISKTQSRVCGLNFLHSFGDSCYRIFQRGRTWRDARDLCNAVGGYLAEVDDANEEAFLFLLLKKAESPDSVSRNYWLGATDDANEGIWVWDNSGRKVNDVYFGWTLSRQDGWGTENCLSLHQDDNYKWNDDDCDKWNGFICEK